MNEKLRNTALILGTAFIASELSTLAFSSRSRYEIKDRAIERLGFLGSEISGRTDMPLQCAHISHKRGPRYNNPSNGYYCTVDEHLIDHILRVGENGLTRSGNYAAIHLLTKQIRDVAGDDLIWAAYDFTEQPNAYDIWKGKINEILGAGV